LIDQYQNKWTNHLADNGGFGGNLYRLTKWDHEGHIEFERNERFWGQKPQLRRIEYTLYKSPDPAWADFAVGKGDLSQLPVAELDAAKRLKGIGLQYTPLFDPSYLQVYGNLAPFDDARVRQAFSLAIDRQAIAHKVYGDSVQPSVHLIPEGMAGYNSVLTDAAGRTGADALTADLALARTLANAYAAEKCGGNFASCPPITIVFFNNSSLGAAFATAITSGWKQAFPGWTIYTPGRHSCPVTGCPPESHSASYGGWLFDYPDPQDFLSQVWTTHGAFNGSTVIYSNAHFSDSRVDALCAEAEAATDQATRLQRYQQAEQLLVAQGLAIPLYQNETISAVRSRVVNWRLSAMGVTPLSVWQQVSLKR
jgi:peptide/nickel transport system substrate-binding protein/oligopeptide transport system substrate-binding protein